MMILCNFFFRIYLSAPGAFFCLIIMQVFGYDFVNVLVQIFLVLPYFVVRVRRAYLVIMYFNNFVKGIVE